MRHAAKRGFEVFLKDGGAFPATRLNKITPCLPITSFTTLALASTPFRTKFPPWPMPF